MTPARRTGGAFAVALSLCVITSHAVRIDEIRVERTESGPVDVAAVMAHVSIHAGEDMRIEDVARTASRDVKSLQASQRYSYVGVDMEETDGGIVVVYRVHPRPVIRRLRIEGAEAFSNRKIRNLLELGVGELVDDSVLAVRSQAVRDAYRKKHYPDASVTWEIDEDPLEGAADITITVDEGRSARVKKIRFPGALHQKPRALRKVMMQKTVNWFSWITKRGAYDEGLLQADLGRVAQVFRDMGYLDVHVGTPVISRVSKKNIAVDIPVTEGILYIVNEVRVEGATLFPVEDLMGSVLIRPNEIASEAIIKASRQAVEDYYGSRGYIGSRVAAPILDADPQRGVVDITFQVVREGPLAYIRNIEIVGNDRTRDKVIRRELTVYPGEIYNQVRIRQSENRLRNLGFFGLAAHTRRPTPREEEYDLVFEVEEKRSGSFVIGAGFSSVDDLIGFVELAQGNFDITRWPSFTGGGQKMKIRMQLGTQRTDWSISFVEPWFMDRRLSLGLDVFQSDRRFLSDEYDQLNTGGSISLAKPLFGPVRLRLIYSLEDIEVKNVAETASEIIKAEEGSRIKSAVTTEFIRDTRNDFYIPTRGNRSVLTGVLAGGILAGETDLYEIGVRSTQYYPLWLGHVLNLRGRIATVEAYGDSPFVPIFDRLFLGGQRTLRGFDFRDVGPRDETGEPIGGKSLLYGTIEYTVPIVEMVRGAVFYDAGVVNRPAFDFSPGDYNSDWGVGLRLDMPGFPLKLDYAWPVEADEFNDSSSARFNFLIGFF